VRKRRRTCYLFKLCFVNPPPPPPPLSGVSLEPPAPDYGRQINLFLLLVVLRTFSMANADHLPSANYAGHERLAVHGLVLLYPGQSFDLPKEMADGPCNSARLQKLNERASVSDTRTSWPETDKSPPGYAYMASYLQTCQD